MLLHPGAKKFSEEKCVYRCCWSCSTYSSQLSVRTYDRNSVRIASLTGTPYFTFKSVNNQSNTVVYTANVTFTIHQAFIDVIAIQWLIVARNGLIIKYANNEGVALFAFNQYAVLYHCNRTIMLDSDFTTRSEKVRINQFIIKFIFHQTNHTVILSILNHIEH